MVFFFKKQKKSGSKNGHLENGQNNVTITPPGGGYVTKCYHAMSVRLFLVFFKIIISIMKSYPLTYFKGGFICHIGVLRPLYTTLNFLKKIIFWTKTMLLNEALKGANKEKW